MSPEKLACLLHCLETAADVVEAIDDPELQRCRGWDLSDWRYDLVPWGVRFTCPKREHPGFTQVVRLPLGPEGRLAREPERRHLHGDST